MSHSTEDLSRLDRSVGGREIADFRRDGAVCLRGLLSPDEVHTLARGIDANLAALSPRAIVASRRDDPGFFIEDFCNWQTNDDYRSVIFDSLLAKAAARLMGSSTVRLHHDHMLTKEPGTQQRTPWDQDQPYYNIDGRQNVSMWIPVDPVRRHSSLEFVAGSHLGPSAVPGRSEATDAPPRGAASPGERGGPWFMPRTFMDHQAKWFPEGSLAELPDVEGTRARRGIDTSPPGPLPPRSLRSLPFEGAGPASARPGTGRSWKTSPEFPGLIDQLPAGAPMDHPLFPLLWSAAR